MATGLLKSPPVFTEQVDYMSWKDDTEVWEMFTDLDKKKQEPAVYLKLASAIFYQIFIFSPNDSPLKTMKNVFYFI